MEVIFIGTGCGIPSFRAPCSLLIKIGKDNLVIDTGAGIFRRLKEAGYTYQDIDYLIYTHFHLDHIADLAPFIFATKYQLDLRQKDLTIIGPNGMREFYEKLVALYGEQISNLTYEVKIYEEKFETNGWEIIGYKIKHRPESTGYRIIEKVSGKFIAYTSDTEYFPELLYFVKYADLLITECAFPEPTPGHLHPEIIGKLAKEANVKMLAITHLYPVCNPDDIYKRVSQYYSGKIIIPYDFDKVEV